MLVEHGGRRPAVAPSALVAEGAVVSGDVAIGAETVVLPGAVVTSQGAPIRIGEYCVVMENAVVRGSAKYPTTVGSYVLLGPHTHVSGATIGDRVYIATGAAVFNGAAVEEGTVVAINGVVHIGTRLPARSFVPMAHIAVGDPARIVPPTEAPALRQELAALGFTKKVFGFDAESLADPRVIEELCRRYTSSLLRHRGDRIVDA